MSLSEHDARVWKRFCYVDEHVQWSGCFLKRACKERVKSVTSLECNLGGRQRKMGKVGVEGLGDELSGGILMCPPSGEHGQGMFGLFVWQVP